MQILEKELGKSTAEATEIMLAIHRRGSGVIAVLTPEVAEQKVASIHDEAAHQGYPLRLSVREYRSDRGRSLWLRLSRWLAGGARLARMIRCPGESGGAAQSLHSSVEHRVALADEIPRLGLDEHVGGHAVAVVELPGRLEGSHAGENEHDLAVPEPMAMYARATAAARLADERDVAPALERGQEDVRGTEAPAVHENRDRLVVMIGPGVVAALEESCSAKR